MEKRGLVPMKGKGDVLTYWLNGTTDKAIKRRKVENCMQLRPLFSLPKLTGGAGNSEQVTRRERKSPKMSLVPSDVRHSFRERISADNRRHSGNIFENGDRPPDSPSLRHPQLDNGSVTTLDSTTGTLVPVSGGRNQQQPTQIKEKSIAAKLLSGNVLLIFLFLLSGLVKTWVLF